MAVQRLTRAVEAFDPRHHTRAAVLAGSRLATVLLHQRRFDEARPWADHSHRLATDIDSTRVRAALRKLHTTAQNAGADWHDLTQPAADHEG